MTSPTALEPTRPLPGLVRALVALSVALLLAGTVRTLSGRGPLDLDPQGYVFLR